MPPPIVGFTTVNAFPREFVLMIVSIYIKKKVCLFFIHFVPVVASITKVSMAYHLVQRKVETGTAPATRVRRGVRVKFHTGYDILLFSLIFQKF